MKDVNQLADNFLKTRFGDCAKDLMMLVSGQWSKAYSFLLDGEKMVLRLSAYQEDFEKDRVMGKYSSDKLPIPKVYEIGKTEVGFYCISKWVSGKPLDELSGPEVQLVLPRLLDTLYELQKLDLLDTQEVGLWRPNGAGKRWGEELLSVTEPRERLQGWRKLLDASPNEANVFDAGVAKLRKLTPNLKEYRGIVHNDLLNRNVMVDSGRITGVIDWGNALMETLSTISLYFYIGGLGFRIGRRST